MDERRIRLEDERRRAIVMEEGPSHPEFGRSFMRYYLPHYVSFEGRWVTPPEWHDQFFAAVFGSLGTGAFNVYEVHREGAKSTIASLGITLAALGLGLKDYLWIVQETAPQAKQSMEAILAETESNPRVARDFPHLRPGLGRHNRPIADRDDDVVFASGQRLQALGAGQKLRGRRHRQHRPDLCIVDDLENDESVLTAYQREKLDKWFSSALMGALSKGADLHVLGTPLHAASLLRVLQGRARSKVLRYPSVHDWARCHCYDEARPAWEEVPEWGYGAEGCPDCGGIGYTGTPTWPSWWTMRRLADKCEDMGATAFAREHRLIVTDEERKLFPLRWMQHAEGIPAGSGVRCRIAVDPAVGEKRQNDRTAIVVGMKRTGERRFHIESAWADRRRGKKIVAQVESTYERLKAEGYRPIVMFESVQAQAWGAQELEDKGIPVEEIKRVTDKFTRWEAASLHYESGRVTHADRLRDSEFEAELDAVPDGEHDDYVDAMADVLEGLETGESQAGDVAVVNHARGDEEEEFRDPRYS